jgi:hypothetical protein
MPAHYLSYLVNHLLETFPFFAHLFPNLSPLFNIATNDLDTPFPYLLITTHHLLPHSKHSLAITFQHLNFPHLLLCLTGIKILVCWNLAVFSKLWDGFNHDADVVFDKKGKDGYGHEYGLNTF